MKKNKTEEEKFDEFVGWFLAIFFLIVVSVFSVIFYTMCKQGSYEIVSVTPKQYEIVGLKRPKHFLLDLKEVDSGTIYRRVRVSKHCNSWRNIPLNSIYTFNEIKYKFSKENIVYVEVEVDSDFCHQFD